MIEVFNSIDQQIAYMWSHGSVERPLVVLHGLGDSSIETYAPRFTTTCLHNTPALFVDLPGFGHSEVSQTYHASIERYADEVASLLRDLNTRNTCIFGHSMGGNVALVLASIQPDLVSHLIVAEPLLHREDSVLSSHISKQGESGFVERGYEKLLRATSLQTLRGDPTATAFLTPLQMAVPRIMHQVAKSLLADRVPTFEHLLDSVAVSSTLIVGSKTVPKLDALGDMRNKIVQIPEAGHSMMVEQPECTSRAILTACF